MVDDDLDPVPPVRVVYGWVGLMAAALVTVVVGVMAWAAGSVLGYQAGYDRGMTDFNERSLSR